MLFIFTVLNIIWIWLIKKYCKTLKTWQILQKACFKPVRVSKCGFMLHKSINLEKYQFDFKPRL